MGRSVGFLAVVVLVASTGACSGEPFAVEFTHPQEHGTIPFATTGVAVDEAVVCATGTMEIDHLESTDGQTITDEGWADMFDAAMEAEGTAEMYVFQDYECDDGSGGFSMKFHNKLDFATFEFEGQQDVGSWEIEGGTGEYGSLSGSGKATLDWDNGQAIYDGQVETG